MTRQSGYIPELVQKQPKVGAKETSLPKEKITYPYFDSENPTFGSFHSLSSPLSIAVTITITTEKHRA